MKRIVIATDGSPSAIQAIEFGLELAEEQGVEPTFVHVAPGTEVLPRARGRTRLPASPRATHPLQ